MDEINTDYIIPSPPSSLSTNTLSHDCLSVDTPTSKGTISMEPYPIGGYDFAFYEEERLSTLTIRPKSQLQPNTTYTITVNNDIGNSSFCRPLEKIILDNKYSFSFTTVDNVTPFLIGHYTFNEIKDEYLYDHSNNDGSYQDAKFKKNGSDYSPATSDLDTGYDDKLKGSINFSNNIYAEISPSFNLTDNFSISLWFKSSANDFPLINWSSPYFNLEVQSQAPKFTQSQSLTCSSIIEKNYWNHLVVTVTNVEQKLFLNGVTCGSKKMKMDPFNIIIIPR
jgi:hypothetical protein